MTTTKLLHCSRRLERLKPWKMTKRLRLRNQTLKFETALRYTPPKASQRPEMVSSRNSETPLSSMNLDFRFVGPAYWAWVFKRLLGGFRKQKKDWLSPKRIALSLSNRLLLMKISAVLECA